MTNLTRNGLEIAIIGLSGRFPGGDTIAEFWQSLASGVESVTRFGAAQPSSSDCQADEATHHPSPPHRMIRAGAVLSKVDQFDAAFFGFNPREAEAMDPQHRLFLECAWEALEDAGYSSEAASAIGVFAGVGMGTYLLYNLSPTPGLIESRGLLPTLVGVDKDYLPTRVSYKLNLKGPSISVGTACSSSLVAVHLACQSLLSGECDLALAAGVAVKVPQTELTLSPDEIVSPDGHCRAFDHHANGTVGGNGIGVVVLKRLEDAIADRDHLYALIKGSAINNDGAMKVGYTAPSEAGQTSVIRAAQIMADVDPETITYMETHGTGTSLGDPIEIAAMTQAFRASTDRNGFCAIGSVKTNVGHLDAAAGMAGLIKTILALDHKQIPASLNFEVPNPQIDFENSPFYVNTQLTEWHTNGTPRRAGVSSFGFGGTNAHVILEEAPALIPADAETEEQRPYQLLSVSAKTATALDTATTHLRDRLQQSPDVHLADVAYTLQVGRWALPHRRVVVAQTCADAVQALESGDPQRVFTGSTEGSNPPVVFMFPGQGSQSVNMARQLYETEPTFQDNCDRCFDLLQSKHGLDLRSLLYSPERGRQPDSSLLTQTAMAQPALFVIEYALAKLWMSWGVQPRSMIGHSIGEYVAACLAGVFSLEDALTVVVVRGQLMQQQPPGAMLAIHQSTPALQPFLNSQLEIAASNSPSLTVVSGTITAIAALQQHLADQGINSRLLQTSHAFHSHLMEGMMESFTETLRGIPLNPPCIPVISNVTGTWMTNAAAIDPLYWVRQLRQPVLFAQGIRELLNDSQAILLEVGPGRTLSTLAKQQAPDRMILSSLPHPQQTCADLEVLLSTLGQLWLRGVPIDWAGYYAHQHRHRLPLPTYPFERQRYWIEPPTSPPNGQQSPGLDKKPDIADWFYLPGWQRSHLPPMPRADRQRCWVVFCDRSPLASAMVQQLQHQGHRVIQVNAGEEFSQSSLDVYTLHPGKREQYEALIQNVLAIAPAPLIAHLWTIAPDLSFAASQTLGFYSLLYLAQALGQQTVRQSIPIGVVSSNLQVVTGTERICPEKATVLGPCLVIPQEYANLSCCNIDVVLPEPGTAPSQHLIDQIMTEILAQADQVSDPVVAYRGNYRWLPTCEPIRLDATHPAPPFRWQGVYLITGGLGGLGLAIAEHLTQTVSAKLVLVSRSALPPREAWQQWSITHGEPDATTIKIRKIQALEAMGAEVLVLSADVTDRMQMQAVIDRAQQVFGPIHGVFHTAGVAGGGIIQLKTPEQAASVMAPKVQGTLVLHQLFQETPLDFLVLFSSLSARLGGAGQVDYCAANCFLDAFACTSPLSQHTVSINWDTWQEIGMGADLSDLPEILKQHRSDALRTGISPSEGWDGLVRILHQRFPQVVVSTKDWQAVYAQQHAWNRIAETLNHAKTQATPSEHQRSLQSTDYVAPRTAIEQQIADLWQDQLGIDAVGVNDNFFELGGHSLLAVRVVSRLRELYAVELSLRTLLLETPTVAGLASSIAEQLVQQQDANQMETLLAEIEQLSQDDVQAQLAQAAQANS